MYSTNPVELRLPFTSEEYCAGFIAPNTIQIRQLPSLALQNTFTVPEQVTKLVIAPDNRLIAAVTADQTIHLFRIDQNERQFRWMLDCKISGVSAIEFSRNSRFLLVSSETGLDFWSLKTRSVVHRLSLAKGVIDQSDSFIAVVSRDSSPASSPLPAEASQADKHKNLLQESIHIYHIEKDTLYTVGKFPVHTNDAASVHFFPSKDRVLVVDSPLYSQAYVCTINGERSISIDLALANRLAVKTALVVSDELMAFGCFDGRVRFFAVGREGAEEVRVVGDENFVTSEVVGVFRETLALFPSSDIRSQLHVVGAELETEIAYERSEISCGAQFAVPSTKFVVEYQAGEAPKLGICQLAISDCRTFLATRADETANSVKVYDLRRNFQLVAVLLHRAPVRDIAWRGARLAVATGEARVFVVDVAASQVVGIFPTPIAAQKLSWRSPCLVVSGRDGVVALREVAGVKGG